MGIISRNGAAASIGAPSDPITGEILRTQASTEGFQHALGFVRNPRPDGRIAYGRLTPRLKQLVDLVGVAGAVSYAG